VDAAKFGGANKRVVKIWFGSKAIVKAAGIAGRLVAYAVTLVYADGVLAAEIPLKRRWFGSIGTH
jgi:hypothetical protein